jgi:hypothetical protein
LLKNNYFNIERSISILNIKGAVDAGPEVKSEEGTNLRLDLYIG